MNFQRLRILTTGFVLASAALVAQNAPPPASAPAPAGSVATPTRAVDDRTYKIGPQDVLRISVFQNGDLSNVYTVQPDGMLSLPLIDQPVKAEDLTPNELEAKLADAWKEQVNAPEVNVNVISVLSKTYKIMGFVNRPSTFPITQPIRVFDAISDAGGFREYANEKDILIYRDMGSGKRETLHFNMKDYRKGKNQDKNILLQHGDVIEVKD